MYVIKHELRLKFLEMCIREVKRHYILRSNKFKIPGGHESQTSGIKIPQNQKHDFNLKTYSNSLFSLDYLCMKWFFDLMHCLILVGTYIK